MRLCFGSLFTVMAKRLSSFATNPALCSAMFSTVAQGFEALDPTNVSSYAAGKNNVPGIVAEKASTANPQDVAISFRDGVLKYLDRNTRKDIVLALQDIIKKDETLDDQTPIELVNNMTVSQIRGLREFVLHEFLAGLFLYTVQTTNSKLQPHVKEITDEYMAGFANLRASVSFVGKYGAESVDVAKSIGADSVALALVAEAGGNCLRCGKKIAVSHSSDDDSVSYGTRFTLSPGDDIVVCSNCRCELENASDEDKQALHRKKSDLHMRSMAREAMSKHTLSTEIRQTLLAVSKMQSSPNTKLREKPTKVENKVHDDDLKDLILLRVTRKYQGVNDELYRLSGEDKVVMDRHAQIIRRMYQDASLIKGINQQGIFNELVNEICAQTGESLRTAAEIVVSYFVQRCEVFDETPKQGDPLLKIGDSPISADLGNRISEGHNAKETA